MRQIHIQEVQPGTILARSILNSKGKVLLASGVVLTDEYLRKLELLNVSTLFVQDAAFEDIVIPEYISVDTQQRSLAILSNIMERIQRDGTFAVNTVSALASDIVEELIVHPDVTFHLTGIATHDDYTLAHSLNCSIYIALLARMCGFSVPSIKIITCGALLHDMGKTGISRELLQKPARLTSDEFNIIKEHPLLGFQLLTKRRLEISSLIAHMAWQHHEKVDGTGYPRGLKGDEILSYARLLSIIDVYEAVTGQRPYRNVMNPIDAYGIIEAGLGTAFDETFGEIFLSRVALYTPGTEVLLSTGEHAVVVFISPTSPRSPIVRLILHPDGTPFTPPKDISLAENPHIQILSASHRMRNSGKS